jgi:membrane protein required for colicin V production
MTAFDYAVIVVILLSAGLGIWRGFAYEIFALGAWITGIVCAIVFGQQVASWFTFNLAEWLKLIAAYALVFVLVFVAISVAGFVFTKLVRAVGLSPVDRGLGAMFGIVRGCLIVVVVVFLLSFSNLRESDWWQQSASAKPFEVMAGILRHRLPDSVTKHFKMGTVRDVSDSTSQNFVFRDAARGAAQKNHRDSTLVRRDIFRARDEAMRSTNKFSEVLLCVA